MSIYETPVFFSVVIPLYNKEATVERAIKSVLNQTIHDFEILVVNDGSTDGGADVVAQIDDPRIHLIHQENQGVSAARNKGIFEAKYDLLAFLDADDEWLPEFLETISRMVNRWHECGLYATRYFLKAPNGSRRPAEVQGLPFKFEGIINNYFFIACQGAPPVWSSATCVNKKAIIAIGGFPVGVISGEDLLTWARLAARRPVAYSMKCLSIFYQTSAEICETVPSRVPEFDDIVGKGLDELTNTVEAKMKKYVRRYCATWHKMRASCYLRFGMRSEARKELYKASIYKSSIKVFLYWILSFLPLALIHRAFRLGSAR